MAELVQYYGTGRRKSAIARVYLRPGSGEIGANPRARSARLRALECVVAGSPA